MGMLKGLFPGGDSRSIKRSADAAQQGANFLSQGRLLLSAFAYNSFLATLAYLMDLLSNTESAIKDNGIMYVRTTYYGEDAAQRGKEIGVVGAFAEPLEAAGDARIWWEALAELTIRLKSSAVSEEAAEFDQPGTATWVELVGLAGASAIPQRFVTTKTGVRVPTEVAASLAKVYPGALAYAQRLTARERSEPFATVSAAETTNWPEAVAVATTFRDERKKATTVMAVGMSLPVMGAGIGAAVKAIR